MRRQEMVLYLSQSPFAKPVDQLAHRGVIVALITKMLSHMRPVALLYPCVIVLLIRPSTREEHRLASLCQIRGQVMVDKLSSVVAIHSQKCKREAFFKVFYLFERAAPPSVFQSTQLRPGRAHVHRIQHPQMLIVEPTSTQRHRVHLQPPRTFFAPSASDRNTLAQ